MSQITACSAYRPGGLCANGFPQNAGCHPRPCFMCGQWSKTVPACQNEDLGKPWIDEDTGRVVFFRPVS